MSLTALVLGVLLVVFLVKKLVWLVRLRRLFNSVVGPKAGFFTGNLDFLKNGEIHFKTSSTLSTSFPRMYRLWLLPFLPGIVLCHPETIQVGTLRPSVVVSSLSSSSCLLLWCFLEPIKKKESLTFRLDRCVPFFLDDAGVSFLLVKEEYDVRLL